MSTKVLNIYQRINAVQREVKYIQKDRCIRTKKGNYKVVLHDDVVHKLRPAMVKHGIVATFSVLKHSVENIAQAAASDTRAPFPLFRTITDLEACFINMDDPDNRHVITMLGYGIDGQDKGPGKAISYATKYALLKTFLLETGDDPDNQQIDYEPEAAKADPDAAALVKDLKNIKELFQTAGMKWAEYVKVYGDPREQDAETRAQILAILKDLATIESFRDSLGIPKADLIIQYGDPDKVSAKDRETMIEKLRADLTSTTEGK
jgi:hypothetical protein